MCKHKQTFNPMPRPVMEFYGRQPDGMFTAGNCVYGDGNVFTYDQKHLLTWWSRGGAGVQPSKPREQPGD